MRNAHRRANLRPLTPEQQEEVHARFADKPICGLLEMSGLIYIGRNERSRLAFIDDSRRGGIGFISDTVTPYRNVAVRLDAPLYSTPQGFICYYADYLE